MHHQRPSQLFMIPTLTSPLSLVHCCLLYLHKNRYGYEWYWHNASSASTGSLVLYYQVLRFVEGCSLNNHKA